jgi:hypothetical protein
LCFWASAASTTPFAATSTASCEDTEVDIRTVDDIQTVETYNEDQLQEIAALMDEIYTILANTSFIPHGSIKRGPHQINATASPSKRNAAELRLMEILPYVDHTHVRILLGYGVAVLPIIECAETCATNMRLRYTVVIHPVYTTRNSSWHQELFT